MAKGPEPFTAYPFSVRKPGESLKLINGNISDEGRQRCRTRRRIEALEEQLQVRREDDMLREGDW